jgi:phage terminase large subunit
MLQQTTAQSKIAKLRKRIRVVRGGTSASKTFTIVPFLIDYAVKNPNKEISIVSETIPHLRRGAIRDFLKIMDMIGMFNHSNWNKSSLTYRFSNGSFIEFFSADQPDKLRGARRDVLFINECNNVAWESYYQLAIRTRDFIYLDYNPVSEFWVDRELLGLEDTDFVVLTYKDNEALEKSIIKEIESAQIKAKTSRYWANWWRVYGLGEIGSLDGVIFSDWKQVDSLPADSKLVARGMDFGYTNDPTTIIDIFKCDNEYYFDEKVYKTGLTNQDIWREFKQLSLDNSIYTIADSAEPKSIQELSNLGMRVNGAVKGADSIIYGVQCLQEIKFNVTSSSLNLIKELRNYTWATDKDGNKLNKPIDNHNHCIDGIRYAMTDLLSNQSRGVYNIY